MFAWKESAREVVLKTESAVRNHISTPRVRVRGYGK